MDRNRILSSAWFRLVTAILIIAVATALRAMAFGGLGRGTPYLLYYPAVMLAALYGGLFVGFLTTVIAASLCFFWIQQGYQSPAETLGIWAFILSGALVSFISQAMRRTTEKRKRVEASLKESEEKIRNIFDNSSIGKSITALDGTVNVNDEFCRMLGFPREELTHQKWQDISDPDDIELTRTNLEQLLSGEKKSTRFIKRYLKKDGSTVWADVNTVLQKDNDGKPLYYITAAVDITERKLLEDKLHRNNVRLEQKSRDLEQLVYVSSHDLRSPLVNIQGFSRELDLSVRELTKAISGENISPETARKIGPIIKKDIPEAAAYIQSSISQMDKQLSAMLKLSRFGRVVVNAEKLDMNSLVSGIVNSLEYLAKEKGARIQVAQLLPCIADTLHANQMFLNLITNAIKYLDANRPGIIHIFCKRQASEVVIAWRTTVSAWQRNI